MVRYKFYIVLYCIALPASVRTASKSVTCAAETAGVINYFRLHSFSFLEHLLWNIVLKFQFESRPSEIKFTISHNSSVCRNGLLIPMSVALPCRNSHSRSSFTPLPSPSPRDSNGKVGLGNFHSQYRCWGVCHRCQVPCRRTTVTHAHLSWDIRCRGPTRDVVFVTGHRALPRHTPCLLKSGFLKTRGTPAASHPRRLRLLELSR